MLRAKGEEALGRPDKSVGVGGLLSFINKACHVVCDVGLGGTGIPLEQLEDLACVGPDGPWAFAFLEKAL